MAVARVDAASFDALIVNLRGGCRPDPTAIDLGREPFPLSRDQGSVPTDEESDVESELVAWRGRTASLSELYARHAPRAGRLAYLLTRDPHLAEDVAQEAFARLITRLPSLRNPEAVDAYLRKSVINLCRKHWRRTARERSFLRRHGPIETSRVAVQPDVPGSDAMQDALDRLTNRQRAALVLRFYEDLSERETARVLGCAVGTVKSLVSRGLRMLREEMGHEEQA
jgi:RNA polymerase sigma-70 factor (sigma-E family)